MVVLKKITIISKRRNIRVFRSFFLDVFFPKYDRYFNDIRSNYLLSLSEQNSRKNILTFQLFYLISPTNVSYFNYYIPILRYGFFMNNYNKFLNDYEEISLHSHYSKFRFIWYSFYVTNKLSVVPFPNLFLGKIRSYYKSNYKLHKTQNIVYNKRNNNVVSFLKKFKKVKNLPLLLNKSLTFLDIFKLMRRYRNRNVKVNRKLFLAFNHNLDMMRYCYPIFFTQKGKALYFISFNAHEDSFFTLLKKLTLFPIRLVSLIYNCNFVLDARSLFVSLTLRYIKSLYYLKSVRINRIKNKINTKFSDTKFFLSYFNRIYFSMFVFKSRYIFDFRSCIKLHSKFNKFCIKHKNQFIFLEKRKRVKWIHKFFRFFFYRSHLFLSLKKNKKSNEILYDFIQEINMHKVFLSFLRYTNKNLNLDSFGLKSRYSNFLNKKLGSRRFFLNKSIPMASLVLSSYHNDGLQVHVLDHDRKNIYTSSPTNVMYKFLSIIGEKKVHLYEFLLKFSKKRRIQHPFFHTLILRQATNFLFDEYFRSTFCRLNIVVEGEVALRKQNMFTSLFFLFPTIKTKNKKFIRRKKTDSSMSDSFVSLSLFKKQYLNFVYRFFIKYPFLIFNYNFVINSLIESNFVPFMSKEVIKLPLNLLIRVFWVKIKSLRKFINFIVGRILFSFSKVKNESLFKKVKEQLNCLINIMSSLRMSIKYILFTYFLCFIKNKKQTIKTSKNEVFSNFDNFLYFRRDFTVLNKMLHAGFFKSLKYMRLNSFIYNPIISHGSPTKPKRRARK